MILLLDILSKCSELGDKVLVFSQSLSTLDLVEFFLSKLQIKGKEGKLWKRGKDWYRYNYSRDWISINTRTLQLLVRHMYTVFTLIKKFSSVACVVLPLDDAYSSEQEKLDLVGKGHFYPVSMENVTVVKPEYICNLLGYYNQFGKYTLIPSTMNVLLAITTEWPESEAGLGRKKGTQRERERRGRKLYCCRIFVTMSDYNCCPLFSPLLYINGSLLTFPDH